MTRSRSSVKRLARALAASLMLAGAVTAIAPAAASAATCQSWSGLQPPSPGTDSNQLNAIAVLSPCNAWAVGSFDNGSGDQTLAEHWNGATWKVVATPSPGTTQSVLDSVRAVSASSIWAVGFYFNGSVDKTLILHWNGHAWNHVTSPSPGSGNALTSVGASSASNAWAVGSVFNGSNRTLILRWNGHKWAQVSSPNPGGAQRRDILDSVTAISGSNAWAAGSFDDGDSASEQVLLLHWNGSSWKPVTGPKVGAANELFAVGASSASNIWAVGDYFSNGGAFQALAIHCC
jgi:hypothetical protein